MGSGASPVLVVLAWAGICMGGGSGAQERQGWTSTPIPRLSASSLPAGAAFFERFGDTPLIITGLNGTAPEWNFTDLLSTCPAGARIPTFVPSKGPGHWASIQQKDFPLLSDFLAAISTEGSSR